MNSHSVVKPLGKKNGDQGTHVATYSPKWLATPSKSPYQCSGTKSYEHGSWAIREQLPKNGFNHESPPLDPDMAGSPTRIPMSRRGTKLLIQTCAPKLGSMLLPPLRVGISGSLNDLQQEVVRNVSKDAQERVRLCKVDVHDMQQVRDIPSILNQSLNGVQECGIGSMGGCAPEHRHNFELVLAHIVEHEWRRHAITVVPRQRLRALKSYAVVLGRCDIRCEAESTFGAGYFVAMYNLKV